MKKVLILDFGGQYNLLVARRVRECGVYCELKSFRISMDENRAGSTVGAPSSNTVAGPPVKIRASGWNERTSSMEMRKDFSSQ